MTYYLNARQTAIITAGMFLSLKVLSLPSLFYNYAGLESFFLFVLMMAIDLFCLWLILLLKQRKNNFNLFNFLSKYLGKFVAKLIYALILIYFLTKMAYLIIEGFHYLESFAQEDATMIAFVVVFMPIIASMAYNGIRSIARTAEFFFIPIIIGISATLLIAFLPQFFSAMDPTKFVMTGNLAPIFKLSFFSADFLPLLLLLDKVKPENTLTKKCMMFSFVATLIMVALYFVYYKLYTITSPLHLNAVSDVISFTKGLDYTASVNLISFITYLVIMFIQGAVFYYICDLLLYNVIQNNARIISITLVLVLEVIFVYIINRYNVSIMLLAQNVFSYYSIAYFVVLPILVVALIISLEGKRAKYKKYF